MSHTMGPMINLFHAAAVGPTLGYIGYQSVQEKPLNQHFGMFLILIAIVVIVFHIKQYNDKTKMTKPHIVVPDVPAVNIPQITSP